jgi:iron(III) transport system substrate-binding protein
MQMMETNKSSSLARHAQAATFALLMATAMAGPAPAYAQIVEKAEAVYMYRGADRDQRLLERARKEGTVVWYTSMSPVESRPLAEAFEKKYGIKVSLWRAGGENIIQRITSEAKGNRFTFDILESNSNEAERLARENLVAEFYSPHIADMPPAAIPASRKYMPDRFNFFVVSYNTNKVKADELPKTYEGFLDPKWKGRIAVEATDYDWMASVSQQMGKDKGPAFLQKLAAMKPDQRKGHPLLAELVSAGEVPVALTTYLSNAESGKRRGAPIDWAPIQPVIGVSFSIALAKTAPHPHAGLLFADFILSPEGQNLLNAMGRFPASKKINNSILNFPYTIVDVGGAIDEGDKREKNWNELFNK